MLHNTYWFVEDWGGTGFTIFSLSTNDCDLPNAGCGKLEGTLKPPDNEAWLDVIVGLFIVDGDGDASSDVDVGVASGAGCTGLKKEKMLAWFLCLPDMMADA